MLSLKSASTDIAPTICWRSDRTMGESALSRETLEMGLSFKYYYVWSISRARLLRLFCEFEVNVKHVKRECSSKTSWRDNEASIVRGLRSIGHCASNREWAEATI